MGFGWVGILWLVRLIQISPSASLAEERSDKMQVLDRHMHLIADAGVNTEGNTYNIQECRLCGTLKMLGRSQEESPQVRILKTPPDQCATCIAVKNKQPEIFNWMVGVSISISYQSLDLLASLTNKLEELKNACRA